MKEAVGESAMTLITIVLVSATIAALTIIIGVLLGNQKKRANCENAGGEYSNKKCTYTNSSGTKIECSKDVNGDYICG